MVFLSYISVGISDCGVKLLEEILQALGLEGEATKDGNRQYGCESFNLQHGSYNELGGTPNLFLNALEKPFNVEKPTMYATSLTL